MNPLLSRASFPQAGAVGPSAHNGLPEVLPDRLAGKPKVTHADDYSLVQVRDEDTLALPPPGHSATIGDRYDGNYCGEVGNNCGAKPALPNGLGGSSCVYLSKS